MSAELDYYEDEELFPSVIHEKIFLICEYNLKQTNLKKKGLDYFVDAIKPQRIDDKENIVEVGTTVVIFAVELLSVMADLYPSDYFS